MRGEVRNVRARLAEGDERERLWKKAATVWPDYESYQRRAPQRNIPVVVLEPRA
jgi:deazaflavin-dependent oxidoreductase (nitroreductase family)